ncbi:MAG: DUF222 domain-containing protein, partial [Acidimicrobiaceae bacterium]|nr:DUF222 domain-containing protein [Acidimicrobiaceae bacterium]
MEKLEDVIRSLESIVQAFDPDLVDSAQATRLVDTFTRGERLCSAGRALAARRVQTTNAWKAEGFRSAAEWFAAKTKSSQAAANDTLNTAEQIQALPATREALLNGDISVEQATAITSAATVDPDAEVRLLDEASQSSLRRLQRDAHAARVAACREQASLREKIHASRYLRTWTSSDGAFEGRFRLTPDHGAILGSALDIEEAAVFAAARRDGRYETSQAYAADALVNLARTTVEFHDGGVDPNTPAHSDGLPNAAPEQPTGPNLDTRGSPKPRQAGAEPSRGRRPRTCPQAVLNIRVDYAAFRRGFTKPGETCEITNCGPISVDSARAAAEDAFIRLHLYDGDRLIDVANPGRNIPAAMRYGLEQRDRTCCVPGCDAIRHLE